MFPPYPIRSSFSKIGMAPAAIIRDNAVRLRDICEKFLVPATNYKIAFLLSRKILVKTEQKVLFLSK